VLLVLTHPNAAWVTQAVRNLAMDLQDTGCQARTLIRDRDGKYPALFDTILTNTGITVILSGVQMPRMNAIMERWIQTCRRELLDRTLVWNQAHLLHALHEYEAFYNAHRPHRGISNARPLHPPARTDHRPRHDHVPQHPPTRPPRGHPPRVRTSRLTSVDGVFGTRRVGEAAGGPKGECCLGEPYRQEPVQRGGPAVPALAIAVMLARRRRRQWRRRRLDATS
jgi:hypothetical protein